MHSQSHFQSVLQPPPLHSSPAHPSQPTIDDPWCRNFSSSWIVDDFSRCARMKYVIGQPALVIILFIVASFLARFLWSYLGTTIQRSSSHPSKHPSSIRTTRVGSLSSVDSQSDSAANGPQAVSSAEDRIIALEVMRDGGLGIDEGFHDQALLSDSSHHPALGDQPLTYSSSSVGYPIALVRSWKDLIINACTIGIMVMTVARYSLELTLGANIGSNWLLVSVLLWSSLSAVSTLKLFLHVQSQRTNHAHPGRTYTQLEYQIVLIYLINLPFEFLDTRSTVLQYLKHEEAFKTIERLMIIRLLAFLLYLSAVVILLVTPRPTALLPRSPRDPISTVHPTAVATDEKTRPLPLEPRRSLISLAYFLHTDSYLWKHISTTATEESIPDLRVDDKAAAVLFRWKADQAAYEAAKIKPSFLRALVWHFRYQLLSQQFFAYFSAVGGLLPSFFLQRILGYITSRSGEHPQPPHVALLYALGLFVTQVFLAFAESAGLIIGRRLSVRMRALLISLVFTKALRRTGANSKGSEPSQSADEAKNGGRSDSEEDRNSPASTGKIANLVSNDVLSLAEIGAYLHFLWPESVIQLVLAGIYLYVLLGYSALAGMFCMIVAIPIQSYLTALWAKCQDSLMAAADKRLGLATEVINNIKVVKFFAWESNFLKKMEALRREELNRLSRRVIITIAENMVSFSVPIFVSIVTFYTHTKVLGQPLTAEQAFTALALFNVFRFPLGIMVGMISGLLQSYVSLRRIEKFLDEKETEKYSILSVRQAEAGDPLVGFKNATFTHEVKRDDGPSPESSTFKLCDLEFSFPEGRLSLIVGRVGSGKGTLLLSLLGETTKLSGEAFLPSPVSRVWGLDPALQLTNTTAYCPQQPWLLSDSIRNNILYGSQMNRPRYLQVLKACALGPDLATFTDGDLTEIGDKGTVLSGGQKARISLARALYSPAKVLLLDDVLSAVDSHSAQHLFTHALTGPLVKDRTCILVTHAVDLCLPAAAFIVSLDRGQVVYAGHPSHFNIASVLTATESSDQLGIENETTIESLAEPSINDDDTAAQIKTEATQRLVEKEHQAVGAVNSRIYKLYYDSLGGIMPLMITMVLFALAELGNVLSTWVLERWADANSNQASPRSTHQIGVGWLNPSSIQLDKLLPTFPSSLSSQTLGSLVSNSDNDQVLDYYIGLYLLAGIMALAFELIRVAFFTFRSIVAGRKIYERLINRLLYAQVRFFDTVPIGRVLNRLSKDVETMDRDLADSLIFLADDVLAALAILVVVVAVLPIGFLFAVMAACMIYVAIGYIYLSSTREIKRSESTSRSPVLSLCTECLGGVTSIRAYSDIGRYTQQMFRLIDAYNRPFYMLWMCNRWLSSRIDVAAAIFTFLVVLYMIQSGMPAALSGFALSYVINFNVKTLWIVRWWSVNEINFNSLERIHEYLNIEQEPQNGNKPPAAWPSKQGSIEVEGLTARYAPHLPPVLKSVSFKVKAGEKIGICGRTGSGKSTLALSFFRFIEAEAGRIVIDGLDISKLELSSLRSRLTIIPQESVLFSATIRWNMDPFSEHDDSRIWDALRRVGMAPPVLEIRPNAGGGSGNTTREDSQSHDLTFITSLDTEVQDGGKNFSTGQRQLLAIARAILKLENSALLILDESTASLDAESDEKVQATIRSEMANSTILCIAHRLKTIIDYDKVLVLSNGEVIEFDEPWKLLLDGDEDDEHGSGRGEVRSQRKSSAFRELCIKSGHFDELRQSALRAKNLKSQDHQSKSL